MGGQAFDHNSLLTGYSEVASTSGGQGSINGADTSYTFGLAAAVKYDGFEGPSYAVPFFSLEKEWYETTGVNNAVDLTKVLSLGVHNYSTSTNDLQLNYFEDFEFFNMTNGDWYTLDNGSVTISEVEYLGNEKWFDDEYINKYKVTGSTNCYIYRYNNDISAYDSLKVEAEFALQFQSVSYVK